MRFSFEKLISQEVTDTHIVINNLKLSDTVSRDYIKSHSAMFAQSILFVLTDTNMAATSLIAFNHV